MAALRYGFIGFTVQVYPQRIAIDDGVNGELAGLHRPHGPETAPVDLSDPAAIRDHLDALDRQAYEHRMAWATVARVGSFATLDDDWLGRPAAGDRAIVEQNRPPDHSSDLWDFLVYESARRLARREGFRAALHAVATELDRAGVLTFEEVSALCDTPDLKGASCSTAIAPQVAEE